jgi:hypothetical protein
MGNFTHEVSMKWLAVLAFAPLLSHAMISPEAIELARLQQEAAALRHTLGGCSITEAGSEIQGLKIVQDKNDKRATILLNTIAADTLVLEQACRQSQAGARLLSIKQHAGELARKLGIKNSLPSDSMDAFNVADDELKLEAQAEATVRSMDRDLCPSDELPTDLLSWHAFFLQNGYVCTAKTYKDMSQAMNTAAGLETAQSGFDELGSLTLPQLKKLFKTEFATELADDKLKIAFIPQLSYENGMLAGLFPYRLFLNQTEKTGYTFLQNELGRLGADVKVIYRNSLAPLEEQVRETEAGLAELDGPHLVISRSMGSRVMNEVKKRAELGLANGTASVAAWYNVGGTPNGSVIADYKSRPDVFYRGVFPTVADTLKLPVGLIAKDPRVVDHLPATIFAALDRANLPTMAHHEALNPAGDTASAMKVYNLIFLSSGYERATQNVDPVYTHMLSYGPTEGSAPLAGAAVDTTASARVFYNLDHLAFWKLTPQEGLAVYLRTLIAGKRAGLSFE